jgi:hypothetical protein
LKLIQCYTHQKKEPILHKIKKLKIYQISWILIANSQEVEEVINIFILDCSSLAPKKNLSMPKPQVSGIFKTEKYFKAYLEN